jgi:PilZ domain-containing protein
VKAAKRRWFEGMEFPAGWPPSFVFARAQLHFGEIAITLPSMAERRQVPRYFFGGKAEITSATTGEATPLIIASISVQGCRTERSGVLSPGQKCALKFEWEAKHFEAEAEVAWASRSGHAGLRFLSVPEDSLKVLRDLCETLPLEPLNPKAPQ